MTDRATVQNLQRRGANVPAASDLRALYLEAFKSYGLRALWSRIVAQIRRTGRYQQADYERLQNETPIDVAVTGRRLRVALDEADALVRSMPAGMEGMLFLDDGGHPVQPDPMKLGSYTIHGGQQRGHWPSSPEISRAMLERYNQHPQPSAAV